MDKTYYRSLYKFENEERYLLWFSNGCDGFYLNGEGELPSFSTPEDLEEFVQTLELILVKEEPILHELDSVASWLDSRGAEEPDCHEVLAAWNLFGDIARSSPSAGGPFLGLDGELRAIYDKVFFGNNLPAITPEGQAYHPTWSTDELSSMRSLLAEGFSLFRSLVSHVPEGR